MKDTNNIKAVLFDMDGTLVDTEPVGFETMHSFLNKNNIDITTDEWKLFDKVWRRDGTDITFEEFTTTILKKYLNTSDAHKYIVDFYSDYENNILLSHPLPNANETLLYLKNKYKLALVTASTTSQAQIILKNNNWENIFDILISHDDFKKSKPDPESFLTAANNLKINPSECVVIEDSKNGTLAGKKANMFVIGVMAGHKQEQDLSACDMILNTLADIPNIL